MTVLVPLSKVQPSLEKGFARGECPDASNGRVMWKIKRGRSVNILLPESRIQRALDEGSFPLGECGTH
jgi:hypothetical protein